MLLPSSYRCKLGEQTLHRGVVGIAVAHVAQAHLQQDCDMRIIETVKDLLARAPALDQAEAPQDANMLRDGGFGDAGQLGQIAGAKVLVEETEHDLRPRGIAKRAKDLSEVNIGPLVEELCTACRHARVIGAWHRASGWCCSGGSSVHGRIPYLKRCSNYYIVPH